MKHWVVILVTLLVVGGTAFGVRQGEASELDLLGVGWTKPTVTVLINASRGVSPTAVDDVQQTIIDWNAALSSVSGAPSLSVVTGKTADIVIHMKVGGGSVLGHLHLQDLGVRALQPCPASTARQWRRGAPVGWLGRGCEREEL